MQRLEDLLASIATLGSPCLASESAACDALARLRFPSGVACWRCGAPCTRVDARLTCTDNPKHRSTLLVATPFHTKTRPRIRALLLAIRALALSPAGVNVAALARDVAMPAPTLWRHVLTLRAMLPHSRRARGANKVELCHRTPRAAPAYVHVDDRIVGESIRTSLNGTHRGVRAGWLSCYLAEHFARWSASGPALIAALAAQLVHKDPACVPLTWRRVAMLARTAA